MEKVEVAAEVEHAEILLVRARAEQPRAQAGAPADHLPELDLRVHRLEEHQVGHLGHVDAGVEHVHRDGDVRLLVLLREVVDQALGEFGLMVDDPGEVALVVRVVVVEARLDEHRVVVVAGKDDGLGQPVAAGHLVAVLHQVLQHPVHGVAVEQPAVHRAGVHPGGQAALVRLVAPVDALPLGLFLVAELVVVDALAGELQIHLLHPGRHQEAVGHRGLQFVGIGGHARFQLEQLVGVPVHLLARGGGQAHQQGVEVAEDLAVLLVDRAVRLVDDHQVEIPHPETGDAVVGLVDQVEHGRVGAHVHPPLGVLFRDQVHRARFRQMRLEGARGLVHQGNTVGQEQGPLHPAGPLEHVHQGDGGARLAGAGGHDQQRLAPRPGELGEDAADGPFLVIALDDAVADAAHLGRLLLAAAQDEPLQFVPGVEPGHLARRIGEVVPQPGLVAVAEKDDRPPAVHLLHAVGIEFGLLLARGGVHRGFLGLDHGQRQAVLAPEHVIHRARARTGGHARDRVFAVAGMVERPPGPPQFDIDQQAAGVGLGVLVGIGHGRGAGADRGQLGAQLLQFRVHRVALLLFLERAPVVLGQFGRQPLQFLARHHLARLRGLRHQGVLPAGDAHGRVRCIGARQPAADVVQLAHRLQGLGPLHRPRVVHRLVADLVDRPRLVEHRLGQQVLQGRLVQQRGQPGVVGHAQGRVVAEEPVHQRLQGEAGVEAGGPRIAVDLAFRGVGGLGDDLERLRQEGEVAHVRFLRAVRTLCRRSVNPPCSTKVAASRWIWRSSR